MDRIRGNSNDTQHVLASSRPSYRPGRPVIQAVIGHAPHPSSPYRFPSLPQFFKHATPAVVYSLTHHRLVLRLVLSRLAERLAIIYIGLCPYMPYSLYHPVGSCSSGLVRPVSSLGVAHDIAIARITIYIHHILASLYPCILISLYLLYTSHTSYSLYTSIDEPRHDSQAARRPASRFVRQIE